MSIGSAFRWVVGWVGWGQYRAMGGRRARKKFGGTRRGWEVKSAFRLIMAREFEKKKKIEKWY